MEYLPEFGSGSNAGGGGGASETTWIGITRIGGSFAGGGTEMRLVSFLFTEVSPLAKPYTPG